MVVVDRKYNGAAAQATLQTTMTATTPGAGGTITVSDDSGYPSTGKFSITIDRGEPSQEHVLINSRSGTTFTIGSRAYDDSVASSHTSGEALVEHWFAARDAQLFVDHVDDVESDPHSTKLLNNARHDTEARHQFGGAYGTPVTPTALTPDIAGAAGTGNNPSREDHVHNVPAATAGNITGAAGEGGAASFARSDHDHGIANTTITPAMLASSVYGTSTTTIDPDDAVNHGASTSVSRTDHQHAITAATPTFTGIANAEGSAATFARSDHKHHAGDMSDTTLTQTSAPTSDTFADWGSETITFTDPGVPVKVYARLDGRASQTGAGGGDVVVRVRTGISFDGGGSYTFGNENVGGVADTGGTRNEAIGAHQIRSGDPTGNILIKAQLRSDDGSAPTTVFANGVLFAQWIPNP
jgi:hypothetical protein